MFSVYKGLLLFILIANTLAIPVFKRESDDGKEYVYETIRTTLKCVCYYEKGEVLTSEKRDKYCDCTPENVEQNQSIVELNEIESNDNADNENVIDDFGSKFSSAKYMTTVNQDDENLGDVQKYGSADAAFFANVEENEAKQEQENINDEIQSQIENQIKNAESDVSFEQQEEEQVENVDEEKNVDEIASDIADQIEQTTDAEYIVDQLGQEQINNIASQISSQVKQAEDAKGEDYVSNQLSQDQVNDITKQIAKYIKKNEEARKARKQKKEEDIIFDVSKQIVKQIKKSENAKYITVNARSFDGDEENLGNVQLYGSADSAFFANLEENEAKQEQENVEDELAAPLFNGDGVFIPNVDDGENVDVAAMEGDVIEDIPEYNSIDSTAANVNTAATENTSNENSVNNEKFAVAFGLNIGVDTEADNDNTDNNEVVNNEDVQYNAEFSNTRLVYDQNFDINEEINAANDEVDDGFDANFQHDVDNVEESPINTVSNEKFAVAFGLNLGGDEVVENNEEIVDDSNNVDDGFDANFQHDVDNVDNVDDGFDANFQHDVDNVDNVDDGFDANFQHDVDNVEESPVNTVSNEKFAVAFGLNVDEDDGFDSTFEHNVEDSPVNTVDNEKFAVAFGITVDEDAENNEVVNDESVSNEGNVEDVQNEVVNDESVSNEGNVEDVQNEVANDESVSNEDNQYVAEFSNTRLVYDKNFDINEEINAVNNDVDNTDDGFDANFQHDVDNADDGFDYNFQHDVDNADDGFDYNFQHDVDDGFDATFTNAKYIKSNDASNDDENIGIIGEAYYEEADDDEEDYEAILKGISNKKKILDSIDEPIVGNNVKYLVDYYNKENENDDEEDIEINDDLELDLEEEEEVQQKAVTNNNAGDESDFDIDESEDLRTIYKKLILKKLKKDIKKMDSEKLIVDILKDALKGESGKEKAINGILN